MEQDENLNKIKKSEFDCSRLLSKKRVVAKQQENDDLKKLEPIEVVDKQPEAQEKIEEPKVNESDQKVNKSIEVVDKEEEQSNKKSSSDSSSSESENEIIPVAKEIPPPKD